MKNHLGKRVLLVAATKISKVSEHINISRNTDSLKGIEPEWKEKRLLDDRGKWDCSATHLWNYSIEKKNNSEGRTRDTEVLTKGPCWAQRANQATENLPQSLRPSGICPTRYQFNLRIMTPLFFPYQSGKIYLMCVPTSQLEADNLFHVLQSTNGEECCFNIGHTKSLIYIWFK